MLKTFFGDIYTVLWVDLRNMRRHWKSTVAINLVLPFLYLIAFGYGLGKGIVMEGVSYLAFVIPGIVALTAFSNSFNGAASKLQVDKFFYKSLDELLMSPVNTYAIVIGKALVGLIKGIISALAICAVGVILGPVIAINLLFLLLLLLSCFVFALFGEFIALVINSHHAISTFNTLVILPMTFLCGTFFSLSQLPETVKVVLYFLPLTHSSGLLRATILGQSLPVLSFFYLLVFGVLFFFGCKVALKRSSV